MKKKPNPTTPGNSRSIPTVADIKKYVTAEADEIQQATVEDSIRQDSFVAEAIEGYEKRPESIHQLSGLEKAWKKRHPSGGRLQHAIWYSSGIVLVAAVAFVLYHFINSGKEPIQSQSGSSGQASAVSASASLQPAETEASVSEQTSSYSSSKESPKNTSNKNLSIQKKSETINSAEIMAERFVRKNSPAIISSQEPVSNVKINERNGYEGMIIYLHDYKIINYAPALSRKYAKNEFIKTGLDSRFENLNESTTRPNKLQEEIKQVSYIEFLEESMYLFKNEQYTDAEINFKEILKYNPEDLNAYFYTGLIEYYRGNYESAITNFILVKEAKISLFGEEAEWYEALSLEKMNQPKNARELFEKIADEKGFYSDRAIEKLKK